MGLMGWVNIWSGTPWVSHALSVASFILTLALAGSLVRGRRQPGATIAWLLVIVLVPYLGIPLYFGLAGRKLSRTASRKSKLIVRAEPPEGETAVERLLRNSGIAAPCVGNQVQLLPDGVGAYEAILRIIDQAKRTLFIETFILGNDAVGAAILAALTEKARGGVEVRLLLDGFGSFWANRRAIRQLRRAGGRVASFLPLFHLPFRGHANLRDHRKILVADQTIALVGGMNLATEYLGPAPDLGRWTDLGLLLRGPAVAHVAEIGSADWEFASGERVAKGKVPREEVQNGRVQIVPSGPDVLRDSLYEAILLSIYEAKERVWIATPYFIPDESLTRALELACRRGVDVRILVPRRSNHLLADFSRASYLRQIEAAGGKIFCAPKMLHAKANVFDRTCAVVGSANMDMRSLFLNFEICLFLSTPASVDEVAAWFSGLWPVATLGYPKGHWGGGTLEGIARILGPML